MIDAPLRRRFPKLSEIPNHVAGLLTKDYQFHEQATGLLARSVDAHARQTAILAEKRRSMREKWQRSDTLLMELLTPRQLLDYAGQHAFITYGGISKWPYLVTWNWQSNVMCLPNASNLCVVLRRKRAIPVPDFLVMQKLMLETDEERFCWTARCSLRGMMTYWRNPGP